MALAMMAGVFGLVATVIALAMICLVRMAGAIDADGYMLQLLTNVVSGIIVIVTCLVGAAVPSAVVLRKERLMRLAGADRFCLRWSVSPLSLARASCFRDALVRRRR